MKRKKLTVRREIVRQLTDADLHAVGGGLMNTYRATGGNYCSTFYMTHCDGCTMTKSDQPTDCRP